MNKKKIYGIAVFIVAAMAAWNVNVYASKEVGLSDVSLANVEALAQSEWGGWYCNGYPIPVACRDEADNLVDSGYKICVIY